jgi:hypothetical protein
MQYIATLMQMKTGCGVTGGITGITTGITTVKAQPGNSI